MKNWKKNKTKMNIAGVVILLLIIGAGVAFAAAKSYGSWGLDVPPAGIIEISGEMTCLYPADVEIDEADKASTGGKGKMACVRGLKGDDGNSYLLRDGYLSGGVVANAELFEMVKVSGNFMPQKDKKYLSVGVIEVREIKIINNK